MTEQEELEIIEILKLKSKNDIIKLFIKMRRMYDITRDRLVKVEDELNEMVDLEDLLENIVDK